ncbi:NmrA family NAD(P)-binding protein [Nocardiopsis flavescens]|uniref:NmrA family NAD(P)-binding protein n=1 Tax=Nocardiopsis flavescens TaxID=758803 RepID=UPI0036487B14
MSDTPGPRPADAAADGRPVLVTGATGRQGGAAARALLAAGTPVRALVRDPRTARARAVAALGAETVTGDLADRGSLVRAARGARAVFSVQMPDPATGGFEGELEQGTNLIGAALEAGVPQFVYTSVSSAGSHTEAPGWAEGRWAAMEPVYSTKAALQDRLRAAGFPRWTIIRPGTFMGNFLPEEEFMFPRGVGEGLVSVIRPGTRLALVAVEDIGAAVAAAVADPERFHGVELDLAGDHLSMAEIAATLSRVLGLDLQAPDMTLEQALAAGLHPTAVGHDWLNAVPQPGRPADARRLGLDVTPFERWVREHADAFAPRRG